MHSLTLTLSLERTKTNLTAFWEDWKKWENHNDMKPLKHFEETLEFICRCSLWAAWATFQMYKQWLTLTLFATAYLSPLCLVSLLCHTVTWCCSYKITLTVPWLFKKTAHHSISCQKSVLISLQCFLSDDFNRAAFYMTSTFLTFYIVKYQSMGICGRCGVQSCVMCCSV